MSETKPEVVETDVDVVPVDEVDESAALAVDQMDSVIAVANRMEEFARAMDTITSVIIKRAYEGDFVCHDRASTPINERKANIGAAAAERIASFLGIKEANWKDLGKEWSEDRKFYTYSYEADFTFGKRTIHAIGRAGNRDKFFGTADGKLKPLDEVDEDNIRRAAFRACRKEGVRTLLGLRAIPITKLETLGLDVNKIKMVNFQQKLSDSEKGSVGGDKLIWKEIKVASVTKKSESKDPKKPWILWTVNDGKINYSMFGPVESKRLQIIEMRQEDQLPVKIGIKIGTYNGQEQYSIEKVDGEVAA